MNCQLSDLSIAPVAVNLLITWWQRKNSWGYYSSTWLTGHAAGCIISLHVNRQWYIYIYNYRYYILVHSHGLIFFFLFRQGNNLETIISNPVSYDGCRLPYVQVLYDRFPFLFFSLWFVPHKASVHLPRIGHATKGFNWYGTERLIRKHLASRGIPTLMYLFCRIAECLLDSSVV